MPREAKVRGRRKQEKERKREAAEHHEPPSKRFKTQHVPEDSTLTEVQVTGDAGDDFIGFETAPPPGLQQGPEEETEFHGLLDPQEQEYYANVNNKIVANDFESDEDRATFIEAVHRETEGKELKVASSQSCSRYLEKIIMLSTPDQLRQLFHKFLGNLTYLVRHRFGSHCCETLFLQAAKYVEKEHAKKSAMGDELPSMEELFLSAAEELKPNMGFLLTERFASHTIRVLFLVLSGDSLEDEAVKTMLASKKKEKLDVTHLKDSEHSETKRAVPKSFGAALDGLIESGVSTLDTTYLRALATHPTGNPVLQLLLRLELSASVRKKSLGAKSVVRKLFPDEEFEEDSESAKFITGLVYDPTGSHLVEILVTQLPGKVFKKLYKNVLKSRLGTLAKNDTASYVAIRILERLGKDDLQEAMESILLVLPTLISRRRTGLIRVLVDRCALRGVNLQKVAVALQVQYGKDPAEFLPNLLDYSPSKTEETQQDDKANKESDAKTTSKPDVHGSLLAQSMLQAPKTCNVVQDSLLALEKDLLIEFCKNSVCTRVVQIALAPTDSNAMFRRQFIPRFYGKMTGLAQDITGSYVADALWTGTQGLHFMKERLADDLGENETQIRESPFGRNVWKNWAMDTYHRRPAEWRALAKGEGQNQPDDGTKQNVPAKQKSAIQLARERHSQKKNQTAKAKPSPATSANAIVQTRA
jgi:nucleolar protein 9